MAADWMVMPRARSAGRKSVTVLPSSTSAKGEMIPLDHVKRMYKPPSRRVKPP